MKIFKFIRKTDPDVVFSSLCYLNSRVILAARMRGDIKVIIRNNNNYFTEKNFVTRLLRRLSYPLADEIIMQTAEMASEFENLFPAKCRSINVIHNPIDIDSIKKSIENAVNPFNEEYVNYVYVGRITKVKGLDILVNAFLNVFKQNPRSRLYIVGKIHSHDEFYISLRKFVKRMNLDNCVYFTDFSTNPYQYINYANSLILPSRNEGLPNVILEAMYLKCPVVVTRSIPILDRIVTKDRGIVVNVEDVEELSKAMIDILSYKIVTEYKQESNEGFIKLFE